jgi:hypothetical protein
MKPVRCHEVVPGYLIVQFRSPGDDMVRGSTLVASFYAFRIMHHASGSLLWLVQVDRDRELQEVRRIRAMPEVLSVSPLTLHPMPPAPRPRRNIRKKR